MIKGAQHLKHAVEEQSLIGNFTKEHEKFLTEKRTQQRREEAAVPPWVGYIEEEEMKKQILALSKVIYLHSPQIEINKISSRKNVILLEIHHQVQIIILIWLLFIQLH